MAGRPGALVRLLPTVQFLVVVQSPFFTEGALAQVTFILPGGGEQERQGGGELEGREWGRQENPELFTDPKADVKHQTNQRRQKENRGWWGSYAGTHDCLLYICPQTHTHTHPLQFAAGVSCLYKQALIFLSRPATSTIYSLLCTRAQRTTEILLHCFTTCTHTLTHVHTHKHTPQGQ